MKIILLIIIASLSGYLGLPTNDDRIIFPDELDLDEVLDKLGDLKVNQRSLFDDPDILKLENTTEEFFINTDDVEDSQLEYGDFYQGDIILEDDQMELINTPQKDGENDEEFSKRTGILWLRYRWPKNKQGHVTVPYLISNSFTDAQKQKILKAMSHLEYYTCIEFLERVYSDDYLYIYPGDTCSSNLGKIGGRQLVSLSKTGCLDRGSILHELIHALGFDHMQSRTDRDKYVYIIWKNIKPKYYHNFEKVDSDSYGNYGTTYDFKSVMHYEPYAFSKNKKVTVLPKYSQYIDVIGQRNSISNGDQERINNMYRCYT